MKVRNRLWGVLNTQLESAADINSFTQNWRLRNHETLRGKTPSTSKTYEFIRYYRCQHRTYHQRSMNPGENIKERSSRTQQNTDCPFRISFNLVKHGQPSCIIDLEGVPGIPGKVKNSSGIREIGKIYSVYSVIREIKRLPDKI